MVSPIVSGTYSLSCLPIVSRADFHLIAVGSKELHDTSPSTSNTAKRRWCHTANPPVCPRQDRLYLMQFPIATSGVFAYCSHHCLEMERPQKAGDIDAACVCERHRRRRERTARRNPGHSVCTKETGHSQANGSRRYWTSHKGPVRCRMGLPRDSKPISRHEYHAQLDFSR